MYLSQRGEERGCDEKEDGERKPCDRTIQSDRFYFFPPFFFSFFFSLQSEVLTGLYFTPLSGFFVFVFTVDFFAKWIFLF